MARTPKPWYWQERGAYYVTIGGQRHRLGETRKEADGRFHDLMAHPPKRRVRSDAVVAILDSFLEWVEKNQAPGTYEWYRQRLQRFGGHVGPDLQVGDLRNFHVQEFIDGMPHSSGTKRNYVRAVKRALRWAAEQGYIDENPIAHLRKPREGKREVVVSEEEFGRILGYARDPDFRDLVIATYRTGCRPQESLNVEARHVDLGNCRWVFPQSEEKMKRLSRVVYLSEEALEITRRLVLRHPYGKLFRNGDGVAWTTDAVNCAFERIRIRMGKEEMKRRGLTVADREVREFTATLRKERVVEGKPVEKTEAELLEEARRKLTNKLACSLAPKYSLYALRHSWATHAIERGVDPLTVAVLMGHQDPSTLAKVYQHVALRPEYLLGEARRAAG